MEEVKFNPYIAEQIGMSKYKVVLPAKPVETPSAESPVKQVDSGTTDNNILSTKESSNTAEMTIENTLDSKETIKPVFSTSKVTQLIKSNLQSAIASTIANKIKTGVMNFLKAKPKTEIKYKYKVNPAKIQN